MTELVSASVRLESWLRTDGDVDPSSLTNATDAALSIGRDVWRMVWRGQATTAVTGDADIPTACGAVLDALALRVLATTALGTSFPTTLRPPDPSVVNVLIGRPTPREAPLELEQALRSMRDATNGVARLWYRDDERWVQDIASAPVWAPTNVVVAGWVSSLMLPRLTTEPGPLARALVEAVDDPSLHLYPSEISATVPDRWALRVDGLEIGIARPASAILSIGKPGKTGNESPQRQAFTQLAGAPSVPVAFANDPLNGVVNVEQAARLIRSLIRHFRGTDVPGAPITHRLADGHPVVDEHALEARLLKGLVEPPDGAQLVLDDTLVARGSQFPRLWGHGGKARYLDAMLRHGTTPLAIELKVATGGQGRYYRRALIQAVLYRHFILNAPDLEPWFAAARLERRATRALIGIPAPRRRTPALRRSIDLLEATAAAVGASVSVLDDRRTPDWTVHETLPEPPPAQLELLSWRLTGALTARWPRALGQVLEMHTAGIDDELHLQPVSVNTVGAADPPITVRLNRAGSLWVSGPTGQPRWTWRGIWNHLAAQGELHEAARIIGLIAFLGPPEPPVKATFPQLAAALLEQLAGTIPLSWRNAAPDAADPSPWTQRFTAPLADYTRGATDGVLPSITRFWGTIGDDGEAVALTDQRTLQVWTWHDNHLTEHTAHRPYQRFADAADTLASQTPQHGIDTSR